MEYLFLASVAYLGLCFAVTTVMRIPYGFACLFTIFYIVFGGYISAFFDQVSLFLLVNHWLGLIALFPSLYFFFAKKFAREKSEHVLGIVHICVQLYLVWYFYDSQLRYFDEFYWGSLVKDFFDTGGLISHISPLMETSVPKVHPPMVEILQSFFSTKIFGKATFHEGSVGLAGFTVLMALFCNITYICRQHMSVLNSLLIACLLLCMSRLFGANVYNGLYVTGYTEYYQSAFFSLGVALSCFLPSGRLKVASIFCAVLLLSMAKATGFLFSLCVIAVYLLQALLRKIKKYAHDDQPRVSLRKQIFIVALLLLSVFVLRMVIAKYNAHVHSYYKLTKVSTQVHEEVKTQAQVKIKDKVKTENVNEEASNTSAQKFVYSWAKVRQVITFNQKLEGFFEIPYEVWDAWRHAFFSLPLMYSSWLSSVFMSIFFAVSPMYILFGIMFLWAHEKQGVKFQKGCALTFLLLNAGFFAWFCVRVFISYHFHTQEEALRAASFNRYMGSYFAAIVSYVLLCFYIGIASTYPHRKKFLTISLAIPVILMWIISGFIPWQAPRHIPMHQQRLEIQQAVDYAQKHSEIGSRIWFITQDGDKKKLWIFRYLLMPQRRTDFFLPFQVDTDNDNVLDIDALALHEQKKKVDYILLWNLKKNIRYKQAGKIYETHKKPVLIPLQKN